MAAPSFWAQGGVTSEAVAVYKHHKSLIDIYDAAQDALDDLHVSVDLADLVGADDTSDTALIVEVIAVLESSSTTCVQRFSDLEYASLFLSYHDHSDAVVWLSASADDEQASVALAQLLGLYVSYAEQKGWRVEVCQRWSSYESSYASGSVSAVLYLVGADVYGHFKAEHGVHALMLYEDERTVEVDVTVDVVAESMLGVELFSQDIVVEMYQQRGCCCHAVPSRSRWTHSPTGAQVELEQVSMSRRVPDVACLLLRARVHVLTRLERGLGVVRDYALDGCVRDHRLTDPLDVNWRAPSVDWDDVVLPWLRLASHIS